MVKLKHARGYRPACLFVVSHPEVTVGQADRADAETSQQSVASVCFKFSHQYPHARCDLLDQFVGKSGTSEHVPSETPFYPAMIACSELHHGHVRTLSGNQDGDPVRAAEAIVNAVESPDPPHSLLLGNDGYDVRLMRRVKIGLWLRKSPSLMH